MTVVAFPDPFWFHVQRRCRRCGDPVLVSLGNGAEVTRDPYYACCNCLEAPEGLGRVLSLVEAEGRPQLHLEEGGTS